MGEQNLHAELRKEDGIKAIRVYVGSGNPVDDYLLAIDMCGEFAKLEDSALVAVTDKIVEMVREQGKQRRRIIVPLRGKVRVVPELITVRR